jgi:hypothetical protein
VRGLWSTELHTLLLAHNTIRNDATDNDVLECLDGLTQLDVSNNKLARLQEAVLVRVQCVLWLHVVPP